MGWATKAVLLRIDEVSDTVKYLGFAIPGSLGSASVWRILKLTTSGTETVIEYAGGNTDYDSIWDDRLSLSYS